MWDHCCRGLKAQRIPGSVCELFQSVSYIDRSVMAAAEDASWCWDLIKYRKDALYKHGPAGYPSYNEIKLRTDALIHKTGSGASLSNTVTHCVGRDKHCEFNDSSAMDHIAQGMCKHWRVFQSTVIQSTQKIHVLEEMASILHLLTSCQCVNHTFLYLPPSPPCPTYIPIPSSL